MAADPEFLLRYLRRLVIRPEQASDATLLSRFIAQKDDRAFSALVNRHGPMVFHVCRRVLGNVHDAEDAFQAAFLVLARKAASVHPRESLTAWLHGVAYRVALKARSVRIRCLRDVHQRPEPGSDRSPDPLADVSARELFALVDEEVRRLPEVYRLPVILCCLEGRSQEEAACQLGWTPGSVKGRLERGRARLHNRLVRRGLTLSAALVAAELSRGTVSAAVVEPMLAATVRAALVFGFRQATIEGTSSQAAILAGEVVRGMALTKMKIAAVLIVATCLLATGIAKPLADKSLTKDNQQGQPSQRFSKANTAMANREIIEPNEANDEGKDPIKVRGHVRDPKGTPLAGARLYVGYAPRHIKPDMGPPAFPVRAISGADGEFGFIFTRQELNERFLDTCRPIVVAVADGFGLDWTEIGDPSNLRLQLVEDFPLEGRILGSDHQPIAGVRIFIRNLSSDSPDGLRLYLEDLDRNSGFFKTCAGPLPEQPHQITTVADGSFRIAGLGRDRVVDLGLEGPQTPRTGFTALTRPSGAVSADWILGVPVEFTATVSRTIRGVVRDKVTGAPVAGIKIGAQGSGSYTVTDKEGAYEVLAYAQGQGRDYVIRAQPQAGQHYFSAALHVPRQPGGQNPLIANFDLVSGILLQGRVTDQISGKPLKNALVEYHALYPNPHSSLLTKLDSLQAASSTELQPDGSYTLMALPGPGVVLVTASPRDSYASDWLDGQELNRLFNDGKVHGKDSWIHVAVGGGTDLRRCVEQYNAVALIKPNEQVTNMTLNITLLRAQPLTGKVTSPDGKSLAGVRVSGQTVMPGAERLAGATFTVEGLNPRCPRQLFFHHQERGLGKIVTVRGDETLPLTVQLEPCGNIIGRMLDNAGKPAPGVGIWFGGDGRGMDARAKTDQEGRFRVNLVPELIYQIGLYTSHRLLPEGFHTIEVESGQTKDLGDLRLAD